jgi:hypothetical protein
VRMVAGSDPSALGYEYFFGTLAAFALLGPCSTLAFMCMSSRRSA